MIQAKLLNSQASLNDYLYIASINFIPGENITVAFQIFDDQRGVRLIPPLAATIQCTMIDVDGNDIIDDAAVIDADDRSMWKFTISQADSENLAGMNIEGKLDLNGDGTVIYYFLLENVLVRTNLSGDC